jgi:hypothetical protein
LLGGVGFSAQAESSMVVERLSATQELHFESEVYRMNWLSVVPKWIFAASFGASVLLLVYLAYTGNELRYQEGIRFVPAETAELLSRPAILAAFRVEQGKMVSQSGDVSFDQKSGMATFSNPTDRPFVCIVSDNDDSSYITNTHFIRYMSSKNQFKIGRTELNTGSNSSEPQSFTAVVVGL